MAGEDRPRLELRQLRLRERFLDLANVYVRARMGFLTGIGVEKKPRHDRDGRE